MRCFAAEANGNDLSRRGSSRTIMRGSFRWGRTFQVNLPLCFQSPRACHSRDITAPPYWKGTKKKSNFPRVKDPAPSFWAAILLHSEENRIPACKANPPLIGRPWFHLCLMQATPGLAQLCAAGRRLLRRGPLVGVVAKVLPTSYRCSTQEQDLLHYRIQEQHCIFSSAIYRYFTWELLVCVQSPFILN